jgi:hypothetical protein
VAEMINKSMKKYQDILNMASSHALNEQEKRNEVNKIVDVLELAEKYLGRRLVENEVNLFTELLIEEENKDEKSEPAFKKGKYKIEIMTPQGKVVRSASSQKGILDVIHSAKTYRILDQNNRDITSKVKAFVKEREKRQMLRKKLKKKSKLRESVLNEGKGSFLKNWLKNLFKTGGKEAGEKAAKEGAEKAAKEGAEKAAKEGAEKAAKEGAEKAAKEGAEKAAKEGAEKAAKEGAEKAAKEGAEKAAKEGAEKAAKEGAEKTGKSSRAKNLAKRAAKAAALSALGYGLGSSGTGVDYPEFESQADAGLSGQSGQTALDAFYTGRGSNPEGDSLETELNIGTAGQKYYI